MGCPSLTNVTDASIVEQCLYYSISAAFLVLRGCVRLRTRGWRKFQADDYVALFVLICVAGAGFLTVASMRLGSTWMFVNSPGIGESLLDCQVKRVKFGSIFNLMNWYTYTSVIWGLKAMMLIFLHRIYSGFSQRLIRFVAIACGVSAVVAGIVITFSCHPIYLNWQIRPRPPERCMLRRINIYTVSGLNAATDLCILLIPIPLLWTVQVSFWKKLVMGLLLCSGVLIMTISFLRIGFLHTGDRLGQVSKWGSREVLVATAVVNMPIISPLFKQSFWRRSNGRPSPRRLTDPSSNQPCTLEGTCERIRNRRRHLQNDGSMLPSGDDESPARRRNDSVAGTTIKTDLDEPQTLPDYVGGDVALTPITPTSHPPRSSFDFDFDLERNAPGDMPVNATMNRLSDPDLPSTPKPALFWAR